MASEADFKQALPPQFAERYWLAAKEALAQAGADIDQGSFHVIHYTDGSFDVRVSCPLDGRIVDWADRVPYERE